MKRLALVLAGLLAACPAAAKPERWRVGNPGDVAPPLAGPVLDLSGGAGDVDAAFQAMIDQARGCTRLRGQGRRGGAARQRWRRLQRLPARHARGGLGGVDRDPQERRTPGGPRSCAGGARGRGGLFSPAATSATTSSEIKGTPVDAGGRSGLRPRRRGRRHQRRSRDHGRIRVRRLRRHGDLGRGAGRSLPPRATFTYGFFAWPDIGGVFTDSHFAGRDRMGRLMGFLARQLADGKARAGARRRGRRKRRAGGRPRRRRHADRRRRRLLRAGRPPARAMPSRPAAFLLELQDLEGSARAENFDLRHRPATGFYEVSAENGVLVP